MRVDFDRNLFSAFAILIIIFAVWLVLERLINVSLPLIVAATILLIYTVRRKPRWGGSIELKRLRRDDGD